MGKYKQWLHHQEVGRRLREQIATHEQERERVQRMAPSHPTTLPDTANPLVRALLDYTGRGGTLGRAVSGRIAGGVGGSDADPQQRQPAMTPSAAATMQPTAPLSLSSTGAAAPQAASVPPAASHADPIAAQLAAQAAQMPADPLEAMRALAQAQARDPQSTPPANPAAGQPAADAPTAPEGATTGEWWQRFRS